MKRDGEDAARDDDDLAAAATAAKRAKSGEAGEDGGHDGGHGDDGAGRDNGDDEKEEGELSEDEGPEGAGEAAEGDPDAKNASLSAFATRADKAWRLDLKRPSRERLAKIPLEWACSRGKPLEGLWLEFGVFSGKTINLMARNAPPGRTVYGFDTFEGLPESWRDKFDKGTFDCKGKFPKVAENVSLVKGLFQDTLEPFLAEHDGPADQKVAVAHLDADLYSATIYALRQLAPRIVPGTLLVFDELINYPGFEDHEWKALLEAAEAFGWTFEWVAQSAALDDPVTVEIPEAQQVALRITATNKFFS